MNKIDPKQFCAPGANVVEKRLEVSPGVDLKLLVFSPPGEITRPPVLFVPGWISLITGWSEVLMEMTASYPVYYLETREKNSASLSGKQDQGIPAYRQDIITAIERLDLMKGEYILFGSSLGATAILDAHSSLPKKPKALILVGPNAEFRMPGWGVLIIHLIYPGLFFMVRSLVKLYLKWFRLNAGADRAQYEKYCRALDMAEPFRLKKAALSLKDYKVWDLLEDIDTPVLVIGGNEDKLHEPENLIQIVNKLPQGKMLDMGTNSNTHSASMVREMTSYLERIKK